jgi:photosystem II stability/assembly factor-like uncharacterized protein
MAKAGIVYAGTDDGLLVFSDPGGSGRWRQVAQHLAGKRILAIAAADALIITVNVAGEPARQSHDGGQLWTELDEAGPPPLELRAAGIDGPQVLPEQRIRGATAFALLRGKRPVLLAAAADGTMLFRSEDGGIHWEPAGIERPNIGVVQSLVPARYHFDIAWAGTSTGELLRSDDRGRSWVIVGEGLPPIRSLAVVRLA